MMQELTNSVKIPLVPELLTPTQIKNHEKNRTNLLKELRLISGVPEIASTLKQQEIYTIVLQPENAYMQTDIAGNFQAVWRNEKGQIVQHTRLQAVKPSVAKIAGAIGSQIMLVSIAMQLNRIEKRLSNIEMQFHNDRISEIRAGITLYNQAKNVNSEAFKLQLISNAITELNRGIEKTLTSLKQEIDNIPDSEISFFDNWFGNNKSLESSKKLKIAEESFQVSLVGIQALAECFAINHEFQIAAEIIEKYIKKLNCCGIESVVKKARLAQRENDWFPETTWLSYLDNRDLVSSRIMSCKNISNNKFDEIVIEIKPEELARICNE